MSEYSIYRTFVRARRIGPFPEEFVYASAVKQYTESQNSSDVSRISNCRNLYATDNNPWTTNPEMIITLLVIGVLSCMFRNKRYVDKWKALRPTVIRGVIICVYYELLHRSFR